MSSFRYVIVAIPAILAGCGQADDSAAPITPSPSWYLETRAAPRILPYRVVDGRELSLWVFDAAANPADDRTMRPVVVMFHGGSWRGGTPESLAGLCRHLAARGMTSISAEYRVESRGEYTPLDALEDAVLALRFVEENAAAWNVDPQHIAAGGESAGGQMAAALATSMEAIAPEQPHPALPRALALISPVIDNGPDGYGFDRLGELALDISPLHRAEANLPPTLLIYGENDELLPGATVDAFAAAAPGRVKVVEVAAGSHSLMGDRSRPGLNYYRVVGEIDAFFVELGWLPSVSRGDEDG